MRNIIRGLHNLKQLTQGSVVTMGNFDGVHRGHQAILERLCQVAHSLSLPSVVVLFEPQPEEFFCHGDCPARLTRFREKLFYFDQYPIDYVLVLRFDTYLSSLSAKDFTQQILIDRLQMHYLVIGDDFHFGQNRVGNFNFLQSLSDQMHFKLEASQAVTLSDETRRVSSTWIRALLATGDLKQAETLLGHPYMMFGHVIHGAKRGRDFGFPTANIYLHRQKTPLQGVYIVKIHGLKPTAIPGIANIGSRPTVDGKKLLLEVHLFDFNQQIYGQMIQVEFQQKIREERRFDSFDDLKQQVYNDIVIAKHYKE